MATEEYQVGYEAGYQNGWNAAQKPFVGLTGEEGVEIMRQVPHLTIGGLLTVETKLKEKNT
jgi:hypothetical protein